MKIDYTKEKIRYYDMNGNEIHEGDVVLMNGKKRKVYRSDEDMLGTDATNPIWIEMGKAVECEYGIYPFDECDEPILVK